MRTHRSLLVLAASFIGTTLALGQSGPMPLPATTGHSIKPSAKPPAAPDISPPVLYDQADNDTGSAVVSQDFETAFDGFDSEAADDFVVPSGVSWAIESVKMNGQYFNGSGPAAAVNLTIFDDNAGVPGNAECSYPLQTPTDSPAGTFTFALPTNCVLPPGTYWLDVQARMDFSAGGEWGPEERSVQSNSAALWQNPLDGFATGCTSWSAMQPCVSGPGPDLMFTLYGQTVIATPTALLVDETGAGNQNGVLEIGETATIAPSWNNGTADVFLLQGQVADFSGPAGPSYVVNDGSADYGAVAGGATSNCETATGDCMAVTITGTRPSQHFDASLTEQPSVGFLTAPTSGMPPKVWTLHVGESFTDVPTTNNFYKYIETIYHFGITGGCGAGTDYCPGNTVTRAQMAVFLLKAKNGSMYTPPACTGTVFGDVPCTGGIFDPWIEDLANQGITGGCQVSPPLYCPGNPVTRAQMAVFLEKTLRGAPYIPPPCTGTVFGDVPCTGGIFDPWIEKLYADGVTGGCQASPLLYCPNNPNTRGQMAVFLTKTFTLVLYGP